MLSKAGLWLHKQPILIIMGNLGMYIWILLVNHPSNKCTTVGLFGTYKYRRKIWIIDIKSVDPKNKIP